MFKMFSLLKQLFKVAVEKNLLKAPGSSGRWPKSIPRTDETGRTGTGGTFTDHSAADGGGSWSTDSDQHGNPTLILRLF